MARPTIPSNSQPSFQTILAQLRGDDRLIVYNLGHMTIPSRSDALRNILIWNPPGSVLNFDDGHRQKAPDVVVSQCLCNSCDWRFASQSEYSQHKAAKRHSCRLHRMCFASWDEHKEDHTHATCGVAGCSSGGLRFRTHQEWISHFNRRHGDLRPRGS